METWVAQSSSGKQILLSIVCSVAGLVLTIAFRNFGTLGANARAGFFLGVLLLVIGVAALLVSGKQTVVIDPRLRRITVEDTGLLGKKSRSIPFDHVVDVRVGYVGKRSTYVTLYYLSLKLRSGEEYALFAPGRFFEGASDRPTVEGWQRRLKTYLGQSL